MSVQTQGISAVRLFLRPVCWLGQLAPDWRPYTRRRLLYEEQGVGEQEVQYGVLGTRLISFISTDGRGNIRFYNGKLGLALDPKQMQPSTLEEKAAIDRWWAEARARGEVR